jgi:hypothetical protein
MQNTSDFPTNPETIITVSLSLDPPKTPYQGFIKSPNSEKYDKED